MKWLICVFLLGYCPVFCHEEGAVFGKWNMKRQAPNWSSTDIHYIKSISRRQQLDGWPFQDPRMGEMKKDLRRRPIKKENLKRARGKLKPISYMGVVRTRRKRLVSDDES
ncbi:hypothetical protein CRE_00676 [Caenorhabditis remanei]|uniref:Uncharacterized protein n=1 Tax=Caenorhabditis remanei TaxID=31234 RepID=E3LDR8_CAERE|nr:hypothetical protein CRE_00676 [Caenorhabditis remanei]